jgi:hypothetical protein
MVALPIELISPTIAAIEAAVEAGEERKHDRVIRCSSLGKPCERAGWYAFRWVHEPEQFSGRMLRLFDTGNVEEERMIDWLERAGVIVFAEDPDTGQQWEVSALDGHLVGHLDGIAHGILEAPATPHLLECKTHNAKSFAQLQKHGVAVAKPEHVAQMQIYMHLKGLSRAFYLAKNKDTDELYAERIHYDAAHAAALMAKAERIKAANEPPSRISDDPASFACKFCASKPVCHLQGGTILRNCRTCLHSEPFREGPMWFCHRHETILQISDQEAGCPHHLYLPGLIAGEQVDADPEKETVTYLLADGTTWTDGEGRKA